MEWIDPRYTDLMKQLKAAEQDRQQRGDDRPVRGFILPTPPVNR
jgi:hypothetical protein